MEFKMTQKALRIVGLSASLVLSAWPTLYWAQENEVGLRLEVDKREVEVGDKVTLSIEFRQATGGNNVVMGEPSISTPENFEIRGTSSETSVTMMNQQTMQISKTRLTLVATKAGEETLGPAVVIYQDAQSKKHEIKSNVITVTVSEKSGFSSLFKKKKPTPENQPPSTGTANPTPASAEDQLRDIKPLLPESSWFLIGLAALIVLLIGGFIWRQVAKSPGGVPPPLPGKATQLREAWRKLGKDDLEAKEFCLALSSLVRECLQYRYHFAAVDFTTEEILSELKKQKIGADDASSAEKCLKVCDRVLYADGNLTGRENLRTLCAALLPKS